MQKDLRDGYCYLRSELLSDVLDDDVSANVTLLHRV